MHAELTHLQQQILSAKSARSSLQIRGGGSKDWYGGTPRGELLDTRAYRGIVSYAPTELVITARCGTPLVEIEAALAEQNQMLAFEPPHFGSDATVGGMVAAGLAGPRRVVSGSVRDFVLGTVIVDGAGQLLRFGGQVMKNVAGYDVSRVMAGALGTLGVIAEVSLKVLPTPLMECTLDYALDQPAAIQQMNQWAGLPLPISASAWHDGKLTLRLSGAPAALNAARAKIGGETRDDGAGFWLSLREQTHGFFQLSDAEQRHGLWRLSVPPETPPLNLPGTQLIEWGGAQRWLKTDADAATIRAVVSTAGGHATLFRGGDKSVGVFHPLQKEIAAINQRLKLAFDPEGIFNSGRVGIA